MDDFSYRGGELYCEDTPLESIARSVGTPTYVYSKNTLLTHYRALRDAFAELSPTLCYSVKSCANLHLLKLLADEGSGMDVVSGGELYRAKLAGANMSDIVYAGVGKTDAEIESAIEANIGYFNIESEEEAQNLDAIARRLGKTAHGALRINPDVADALTHAKTTTGAKATKFGVDIDRAAAFFERFGKLDHLKLDAIHLHLGSPIYSADPYVRALTKTNALMTTLKSKGFTIKAIDLGGGFAADYETGASPAYVDYAAAIVPLLRDFVAGGGRLILEPGRTLVANAAVLLLKCLYTKQGGDKRFIILDGGMNHLIRPTLYDSWMFMWPARVASEFIPHKRSKTMPHSGLETVDVVGPICETGDYLAKARALPPMQRGDLLAVFGAGAYGMVMASNYNATPRPAEVLVDGDGYDVIRRRETYQDLVAPELI